MEPLKNNFDLIVESIETRKAPEGNQKVIFDGVDLDTVFEEMDNSLEKYRFDSEKKYNDSQMELAQIFLSI